MKGLEKRPANAHGLPHRLHLARQYGIRPGEFLEGPPWNLGHHVIYGRFETGGSLPRDIVGDLIEGVADAEFGGDLGDRETGRLRGQGARPGDPRVHLYYHHFPVLRVDGELDVRSPRLDSDLTNDRYGRIPHELVLLVRKGLGRGYRYAVAGVDPHRVDIFDRANYHHVVISVPHHLEFVFLPSHEVFLHQDFVYRRLHQTLPDQVFELTPVIGDPTTRTPKCKGWPHDQGQAYLIQRPPPTLHGMNVGALRYLEPDAPHGLDE